MFTGTPYTRPKILIFFNHLLYIVNLLKKWINFFDPMQWWAGSYIIIELIEIAKFKGQFYVWKWGWWKFWSQFISKNQKVNKNALKFYSDLKLNGPFVLKIYKNYTLGRASENTLVSVIRTNEVFEEKISWKSVGKTIKKISHFIWHFLDAHTKHRLPNFLWQSYSYIWSLKSY